MYADDNTAKTLGPQSARLIVALYEAGREIFDLQDVCRQTGLSQPSARSLVRKMAQRGLVTRLKPGLFQIIPLQLGTERQYVGNPHVIARELVHGDEYYISHASAMDIHGMLTQPQFVVYITTLKAHRPIAIHGSEYRFVRTKKEHFFGLMEHWVDKQERVTVSDLERTIVDGLKQPEYCGGFTEVAKAYWIRRADMNADKLADYALRLGISVVARRLGFLLELFDVQAPAALDRLQEQAVRPYLLLDPIMPNEGKYLARWKLRVNVEPAEIHSLVRT
jgi:predicted transcriptional regulator of viral defense system